LKCDYSDCGHCSQFVFVSQLLIYLLTLDRPISFPEQQPKEVQSHHEPEKKESGLGEEKLVPELPMANY
jgi:hypothetical protein